MTHIRLRGWAVVGVYSMALAVALWQGPRTAPFKPASSFRLGPFGGRPMGGPPGREGAIALVEISGPISFSSGRGLFSSGAGAVLWRLRTLREDPDVAAVILRINSPGGSVAAVQEIHQEVLSLRKAGKRVVASFGDVAASGGYYIAVGADRIVADPGSLLGSIGVLFQLGNAQELFRKVGLRVETIKSGAMKDAGSPFRSLGPQERAVFRGIVAEAYGQFLSAVAEGRKMTTARLRPLADGRVFTGSQALRLGLVDRLGNFETAVEEAKRLAGLTAAQPRLLREGSPWERIFGFMDGRLPSGRAAWQALMEKRIRFEYVWE